MVPSTDSVGMQPLHWATTEGHLNVMHFLIGKVSAHVLHCCLSSVSRPLTSSACRLRD